MVETEDHHDCKPSCRKVYVHYNEFGKFIHILSLDNKPVLSDDIVHQIKQKGFIAASDGHCGINAIILAPEESSTIIASIFASAESNESAESAESAECNV